jgi:hypothetical protein
MLYYPIVVAVLTLLNQGNLTYVTIRVYSFMQNFYCCFTRLCHMWNVEMLINMKFHINIGGGHINTESFYWFRKF